MAVNSSFLSITLYILCSPSWKSLSEVPGQTRSPWSDHRSNLIPHEGPCHHTVPPWGFMLKPRGHSVGFSTSTLTVPSAPTLLFPDFCLGPSLPRPCRLWWFCSFARARSAASLPHRRGTQLVFLHVSSGACIPLCTATTRHHGWVSCWVHSDFIILGFERGFPQTGRA